MLPVQMIATSSPFLNILNLPNSKAESESASFAELLSSLKYEVEGLAKHSLEIISAYSFVFGTKT